MNSSIITTRYITGVLLGAAVLVSGFTALAVRAHAQDGSVAPVLSNIASTTTDTGATISWTSDQAGTAQVFYGPSVSYGASSTFDNSTSSMSHTSFLGGLSPNTLYHFEVVTGNASGTMATSSDMTFTTATTTPPVASSTAPVISTVLATPTQTGATITWSTDIGSNSQVMYGTTNTYGNTTTLDPTQVTSHSVLLSGLVPNTLYHFQAWSTGASTSAATSTDMTFTTLIASSTGGGTGTSTGDAITDLQNAVAALQARVTTLEAEVAALMGGSGGTTTPPTSSGTLDQSNITVGAGGTLNFGGRGFPREENITITLNGSHVATVHADGGGNFSTGSLTAPTTPGTYTYVFTGSTGDVTSATVTVH